MKLYWSTSVLIVPGNTCPVDKPVLPVPWNTTLKGHPSFGSLRQAEGRSSPSTHIDDGVTWLVTTEWEAPRVVASSVLTLGRRRSHFVRRNVRRKWPTRGSVGSLHLFKTSGWYVFFGVWFELTSVSIRRKLQRSCNVKLGIWEKHFKRLDVLNYKYIWVVELNKY